MEHDDPARMVPRDDTERAYRRHEVRDDFANEPDPRSQTRAPSQTGLAADARRIAAALRGALEGLEEALETEDLEGDGRRATHATRDTYDAIREGTRAVANEPEIQRAREAASGAWSSTRQAVGDATEGPRARVRSTWDSSRDVVRDESIRVRETAARARVAPRNIYKEVADGVKGWYSNMARATGFMVGAGILAIVALVLFAIWVRVALVAVAGEPLGSFLSFLAFVILAGAAYAGAKWRRDVAHDHVDDAREGVRNEVRHVTRPLKGPRGRARGGI